MPRVVWGRQKNASSTCQDIHILIAGNGAYVNLGGKRYFVDVIKDLGMGDYPEIWGGPNVNKGLHKREVKGWSQRCDAAKGQSDVATSQVMQASCGRGQGKKTDSPLE